ncbi:MAG: hypothetical protein ABII22_06830 [Candidatus Micrarchaeota archaeon]
MVEKKVEEVRLLDYLKHNLMKDENVAAGIACIPIIGWILAYFSKKESPLVRFYILQTLFMAVTYAILIYLLSSIWAFIVGYWIVSQVVSLLAWAYLLTTIYLMYMAYNFKELIIPVFGDLALRCYKKREHVKENVPTIGKK